MSEMSIVIVGAGPNLGAAVARRFGREGLAVGLVARDRAKLEALAAALSAEGITADFAPGGDHEPSDVADVLWRHHVERSGFQTRLGID